MMVTPILIQLGFGIVFSLMQAVFHDSQGVDHCFGFNSSSENLPRSESLKSPDFRRKGKLQLAKKIRVEFEYRGGCFPKNRGTPKSSILIGFALIKNHPFWGILIFVETPS